jgi:two-component system sensor histidine kinase UhpB
MLLLDLVLVRRALEPLGRLSRSMQDVDLLRPGLRADVGADGEIARLTAAFNAMLDRLEQERRGGAQRSVLAVEEERRAVSRELHDQVGQSLTGVLLQIERAAQGAPADQRGRMEEAREAARTALEEVRRIAQRLRPEVLDDLGLSSALHALAQEIGRATGVRATCSVAPGLPRLSPEAELVVYRVTQESLTNVARHAAATVAEVRLVPTPHGVRLTVRDDGGGVRPGDTRDAGGIQGMRERALLIDAELLVEAPAEGGTLVRLDVPHGS